MPTIRRYFVKSVKNFLLIIAAIVLLPLVWYVIMLVISLFVPDTDLLRDTVDHIKEVGIGLGIAILIFLGYKAFRVFKTEKHPGQEFIKMAPAVIVWAAAIFYLANTIAARQPNYNCQKHNYNEKLNGGIKEFNGKKYTINICGAGRSSNEFYNSTRLQVFNEQGELVAVRYYKVFWGGVPGHEPIKVHQDSITYHDDDYDAYFKHGHITMPPTFIDWIRARVPLFS
jgi:hypothetical protein